MQHQEDYASDASKDEQYFESYADLSVHKAMLRDRPRMNFYKTLLTDRSVVEGKVVVDVGSGSGILSCWAAQSGAAHVLSIEASSLAEVQRQIISDNGVAGRVTVVPCTVEEVVAAGVEVFLHTHPCVRLHGGVALVVSEWMGFYLFHECMLPSVIRARNFFREVNAALQSSLPVCMLPSNGRLLAAPITLKPYYAETFAAFWDSVDDVCLHALGKLDFQEHIEATSPLVDVMPPRALLHDGAVFWEGSFDTLSIDDLSSIVAARTFDFSTCITTASAKASLVETGHFTVDGFTLWFQVSYGDAVLDTSPLAPPTHWKQTTVLLPREFRDVQAVSFHGLYEQLELSLRLTAKDLAQRCYRIEFELN
ncbi:Ribosomal protein L11 methyltransferase (PrmA), putative [Leishmania lindenbergi]|uniref:Ribosomal protein L11 methyltransferase (PrmA) n=1 Tax=Leishmania lindenbergi TaxID=651832 RepID=A0AAW3AMP6_9TRYP